MLGSEMDGLHKRVKQIAAGGDYPEFQKRWILNEKPSDWNIEAAV